MSWSVDFGAAITPIHRGRRLDISPLTVALAAPFFWAVAIAFVGALATGPTRGPLHPTPYLIVLWSLQGLGIVLLPLSLLSLILDNLRRGGRLRANRSHVVAAAATERAEEADCRAQLGDALGRDLQRLYRQHHQTLVEQAKAKLKTDPYGRTDTSAVAEELNYFQEQVVTPALTAKGYPKALIEKRFETDRQELLTPILDEAR